MPSVDVWEKKGLYESRYAGVRSRYEEALNLYNRDFTILPEELRNSGARETIPLTGRSLANIIAGAIIPSSPEVIRIHIDPTDNTEESKRYADRAEAWAKKANQYTDIDLIIDPMFQHALNLVLYGVTGERVLPVWNDELEPERDTWESETEYRSRLREWDVRMKTQVPFDVMPIDPLNSYHDGRFKQPTEFIEYGRMLVDEVRETERDNNLLPDYKHGDTVDVLRYVGEERRVTVAGKEGKRNKSSTILDVPNILRMPYSVAKAGDTKIDPFARLKHEHVGMLWHMGDALRDEARIISTLTMVFSWSPWKKKLYSNKPNAISLDWTKPWEIADVPDDVKIGDIEALDVNPEGMNLLAATHAQLERMSGAKLLGGAHVGARSGMQEQLYLEQGMDRYQPLKRALELIVANRLSKMAFYQDKVIRQQVIRGHKVRFDGYYRYEVSFKEYDLIKNIQLVRLGIALVNNGLMDKRQFLEEIKGDENASQTLVNVLADRVMDSEHMKIVLERDAARDAGLDDVMQRAQEEAKNKAQATGDQRQVIGAPDMRGMQGASEGDKLLDIVGGEDVNREDFERELTVLGG